MIVRVLALLLVLGAVVGCGGGGDGAEDDARRPSASEEAASTTSTTAVAPPQLPRGGTEIFPAFRVVAHYGNAQSSALGILGETPPEQAAERLAVAAEPFAQPDRPVLPAFELIVTVAQGSPGPDGDYSTPTPVEVVEPWLEAARAADMLLVLDLQPGAGDFLTDAKRFEDLLREPDVGLALDSEWRMAPGEVPGETIGSVDAAEVDAVSEWLAGIVAEERLPQKLFVLHLFTESMVTDRAAVVERPGLATVFHVDGFGGRAVKLQKYEQLRGTSWSGLKLFLDEDTDLFTPEEVLALDAPPDLVTYQ